MSEKANRNIIKLSDTTTGLSNSGERNRLVEENPILVDILEIDHTRQRTHVAVVQVDALDDEESSRGLGFLRVLAVGFFLLLEEALEVFNVVVLEVAHVAS